ncbi:DNA polymerase III subunit delta [Sphingomonas sp.]|uniref:DNA polymerase III subunit delta n=1 Tax=Sphingomonas sp. TaxID=28214 RepID=UPI0025EA1D24|nr:DNA polymerase III subunit delta [Sphingomonas sp.]MBV9527275.1 DNA polymerase III subunit delta [Sphingomonas sp.]
MKTSKAAISRAVAQPDPAIRFYLFHGPDEAQSRGFGEQLLIGLGANREMITGSTLRSDPARLTDEAGALSLFGGKSLVWIEPAGDEIAQAVEALLAAPAVEKAVAAIAGDLRKTSALLKLAEAAPGVVSFKSYVPEGQDARRMVTDVGRRFGLKVEPGAAARIADACGNDQAIVTRELEKYALYVDASPQSPRVLGHDAIDAVGAALPEGELLHLADLALAGRIEQLSQELARLPGALEAIPVVRSLQRRLLMLAPARARIERGERSDAVMTSVGRSLFWKDKALFETLLQQWSSDDLARLSERAGKLERSLIFSSVPDQAMLGEELLAIARAARGRR